MRLIDADLLKGQMESVCMGIMAGTDSYGALLKTIDNAPTVDAVEVVRCKDCVYFWDGVCTAHTDAICTDENEFCSWGERKDD